MALLGSYGLGSCHSFPWLYTTTCIDPIIEMQHWLLFYNWILFRGLYCGYRIQNYCWMVLSRYQQERIIVACIILVPAAGLVAPCPISLIHCSHLPAIHKDKLSHALPAQYKENVNCGNCKYWKLAKNSYKILANHLNLSWFQSEAYWIHSCSGRNYRCSALANAR